MTPQGGGTKVDVETDFTLTGRLARFGRGGMIQDVSNRLLRDFAGCLQSSIESEPECRGPRPPRRAGARACPGEAGERPVALLRLADGPLASRRAASGAVRLVLSRQGGPRAVEASDRTAPRPCRRACWTRTSWPLGAASFAPTRA